MQSLPSECFERRPVCCVQHLCCDQEAWHPQLFPCNSCIYWCMWKPHLFPSLHFQLHQAVRNTLSFIDGAIIYSPFAATKYLVMIAYVCLCVCVCFCVCVSVCVYLCFCVPGGRMANCLYLSIHLLGPVLSFDGLSGVVIRSPNADGCNRAVLFSHMMMMVQGNAILYTNVYRD